MDNQQVILVDENDQELGYMGKLKAHQYGKLHRAFSIFLLHQDKHGIIFCLLQQRQQNKYHSPGLWANACCSHPRPHEDLKHATARRLQEELGISLPLHPIGAFTYRAVLDQGLIEHEYDHVWIGVMKEKMKIQANPDEVMNTKWVQLDELKDKAKQNPTNFCAWINPALKHLLEHQEEWINWL